MLTDKQSLILCGVLAVGFFVCGILELLDSLFIKGLLALLLIIILSNFFYTKTKKRKKLRKT
ncbi:hypothetical protein AW14_07525 [Siansivirga zeaxanthinifaciens CC-SAMT-1]|uniref:Phosphatidate cytidylyltransferase n=1 Tax=Siansivirga zeaxanthinifaciens CC-SAMT-1 TaxID=1454006 RepID=A0A0C5W0M2_9FLAO|nr:hypothetical protein AW14_07525 [Siansivirga zeaxanthinifaciens CC-SAMT-1]